ncbi:hypothetical protein [Imhoffiella purpurea]|uniref:Uncharacterized protein n=1 Tax=Imhoffiella purpurea TaxID=1249627 RepID=W9VEG0_9GAMM|nr:hypothetical protein [Imhoffiella purpurea]EXJ14427.1 hypothetical protein D779_2568 [Imhoffiella purpurea]
MPSFPLQELRRLLRPDTPKRGVVSRVSGQRVQVATSGGIVAAMAGTSALAVGQRVTLRDGIVYPAPVAAVNYPL